MVYIHITVGVPHIGVYTDYSWSSQYWCIYRLQLEFTILVKIQISVGVPHIGVYTDYSWSSSFYVYTWTTVGVCRFMHLQVTDYIYSSAYWCKYRSQGVLSILKSV